MHTKTVKRFRARVVKGNYVVWDYSRKRALTIPLADRKEAIRYARGFPQTIEVPTNQR